MSNPTRCEDDDDADATGEQVDDEVDDRWQLVKILNIHTIGVRGMRAREEIRVDEENKMKNKDKKEEETGKEEEEEEEEEEGDEEEVGDEEEKE